MSTLSPEIGDPVQTRSCICIYYGYVYLREWVMLPKLKGGMTMIAKVGIALALAAFLAVPSASFAASKKESSRDVTKCEGGACTAVNPDRDFINTSREAQYYRRTHKKHKTQPKN